MEFQINDSYFSEKNKALNALYQVLDPELMVNIIDLGLVYGIDFSSDKEITVTMTLTSHGCPLGEAIEQGVKNALSNDFPEFKVIVNVVWEPQWSFEEISPVGREKLGF